MSALWEILVPTKRNDDRPYRTRHHKEWDKRVRKISGGLTILPVSKGQWVSPHGELFSERMIPVRVIATDEQMERIVKITLQHYPDQLAVLAYKLSDTVLLRYRSPVASGPASEASCNA